jgi:hypothetical protein
MNDGKGSRIALPGGWREGPVLPIAVVSGPLADGLALAMIGPFLPQIPNPW